MDNEAFIFIPGDPHWPHESPTPEMERAWRERGEKYARWLKHHPPDPSRPPSLDWDDPCPCAYCRGECSCESCLP